MKDQSLTRKIFNAVAPKPNLFKLVKQDHLDGLQRFLERDGKFNSDVQNFYGYTELMFVAVNAGTEGLKIFFENGGQANPAAQAVNGETERRIVKLFCDAEGLALYSKKAARATKPAYSPSRPHR